MITGLGFGFYGLDKNKQTKVLEIGYLFVILVSVGFDIFNIYNFFNLELTHKNIFTLVIPIISLVFLTVTYFFVKILNISVKQLNFTSKQNDVIEKIVSGLEKNLKFTEFNTKLVVVLKDLLDEIDEKEFQKKYRNSIERIDNKVKKIMDEENKTDSSLSS